MPHVLIFLTGVQGKTEAEDKQAAGGEVKPADQGMFSDLATLTKNSNVVYKGFFGSIASGLSVTDKAEKFIYGCEDYDPPTSKLIVYGYSAGGTNALTLSRSIDGYNSWERRQKEAWVRSLNPKKVAVDTVTIDLLITVDAAARGYTPLIHRTVGDCVARNANYYQTNVIPINPLPGYDWSRSEGGPNVGKCNPKNLNMSSWGGLGGPKHGTMQEATKDQVLKEVSALLGIS